MAHPDRVRANGELPKGYQFGDAQSPITPQFYAALRALAYADERVIEAFALETAMRAVARAGAARIKKLAVEAFTANVIEGDHH